MPTTIVVDRPDGKKQYSLTQLVLFLFHQLPQRKQEEFYKEHASPCDGIYS